nr:MAG TPA: hypothetical protein [Crassvirales sp.]
MPCSLNTIDEFTLSTDATLNRISLFFISYANVGFVLFD